MPDEKKEPIDFLKVVEGIKKTEAKQLKEAFRQLRILYLEMIEAGFTKNEAIAYIAAMTKPPIGKQDDDNAL